MEAIRIEFQPNLKSKIIDLLSTFSPDELKIVEEDSSFVENKKKLKIVSDKVKNGTAKFASFEDLDEIIEKTISKYEN